MDARTRFVLEQEQDEHTMTALCQIYGVSRQTGYQWLRQLGIARLGRLCRFVGR